MAFLSAVVAEFLLGDQWLAGFAPFSTQVPELVVYMMFYGCAAVLIRDIARTAGRGWPTILLLGLAFGVVEEGIVDQSLFNPHFAGTALLSYGWIPALGIAGPWTLFVLSLHVVWSIGAPVAVVEALFPHPLRRSAVPPQLQAPWLGLVGRIVVGVLFLVGAGAVFSFSVPTSGFAASGPELIASAIATVVIVIAAFLMPRRAARPRRGTSWLPVLAGLGFSSVYYAAFGQRQSLAAWLYVAIAIVLIAAAGTAVVLLGLDPLGLAVGALGTYVWVGFVAAWARGPLAQVEQFVIVAIVAAVVGVAIYRTAAASLPRRA